MSGPTVDVSYRVDGNHNCTGDIKDEESVKVITKSNELAANVSNSLQLSHDAAPKRKGSFVITDIQKEEDFYDSDSTIQADQPTASELAESPKRDEALGDSLPWATPPVIVSGMSLTDSHSRFRIVKIESRDRWHRGRWTCHDFADPPERVKTEQILETESGVDNVVRNGTSIYYIPGVQDALKSPFGIVYNTGGHPVLEANFLPSSPKYARGVHFFANSLSISDDASGISGVNFFSQRFSAVDQPELFGHTAARKLFASDEDKVLSPLKISVSAPMQNDGEDVESSKTIISSQLSSSMLTAADSMQKTTGQTSPLDVMMSVTLGPSSSDPDMSGSGVVAIDSKIEQAMELLKSHLMFAIHEEIEQLKEQITSLSDRNAQLEYENKVLKARASKETLTLLLGNPQT